MPAAKKVRDLLRNSADVTSIISAENICAFNLPEELADKQDKCVCLVQEISNQFVNFASDRSHARRPLVQIQVWITDNTDIDKMEQIINNILEGNNWYCYRDAGIDQDPDTQELFWTIEYIKTETKN